MKGMTKVSNATAGDRTGTALGARTGTHSDAICRHLEERIVSGELEPGEKLDEVSLAKEFGVSKTPVREALVQLAAIDFVQLRQRSGATVARLSLQRMVHMFEVMAELEGMCACLAAARMSHEERDALGVSAQRCLDIAERSGIADYAEANFAFHEIIYRGSHNDFLAEQASTLRKRLVPYRRYWLTTPNRLRKSAEEHDQVANAILSGNEEEARRFMRQHLGMSTSLFSELIDKIPASYLTVVK
jgi:DNA-binding GntR family transcriptional regulator